MKRKMNGSYYTPEYFVKYLLAEVNDIVLSMNRDKKIKMLEPSSGDGIFLKNIQQYDFFQKISKINLVEKDNEELIKANEYIADNIDCTLINKDFLEYAFNETTKYDIIIGNPPYIKKDYISGEQKEYTKEIASSINIETKSIINIWQSFMYGILKLIDENGIVCLVLPSEFLQVKYSEKIREHIYSKFRKIRIYTFEKRIFSDIEQDVIALVFYNDESSINEISYRLYKNEEKNMELIINNNHSKYISKWSNYYFSPKEIEIVDSFSMLKEMNLVKNLCDSQVGIVTGANDYFILSEKDVCEYNLSKYVKPIIKKSSEIGMKIKYKYSDFEKQPNKNFILCINDKILASADKYLLEYLEMGIENKIDKVYKCTKRKKWYEVPSIWASEGIFYKRTHMFLKLIINKDQFLITDTGYRIKMKDNLKIENLSFCFYNSITFIDAEMKGRYYGGGVLEITPNEFKDIKVPYFEIEEEKIEELDFLIRNKTDLNQIIDFVDEEILFSRMNITKLEIKFLKQMRMQILKRRIR